MSSEFVNEERERLIAEAAHSRARAAHAEAKAARSAALARQAEADAERALIELERERERRARELVKDDWHDRVYRYIGTIDDSGVRACISQLNAWHREDPGCDMTIMVDSPGGAVIPGFHLFDHICELRTAGHRVTTVTRGYAASMAGILLQAGDRRVMGPNATLMIHEVSFGALGKISDVEDTTDFARLLWNRALDIFAERCAAADPVTATKRLTRRALETRSRRKNWWIRAADALTYGLVDEIA